MKHSNGRWLRLAPLAIALGLSMGSAVAADGMDPTAEQVMRAMSKFLGGTKAFSVSADIANEIITQDGQKLQLNSYANLLIERPNHFQVNRQGSFADVLMNYDGAKLTIYGKALNAYLQKDVAGTIDNAVREIERGTGLVMPGADLLLSDSYAALTGGATSSGYYGTAFIGGVEVHHVAYRTPKVDLQMWVKTGDEPIPMKYVITTKWMTGAPQYSVHLSNWNLKPAITANKFRFVPPATAAKVEILPVDDTGELVIKQGGK